MCTEETFETIGGGSMMLALTLNNFTFWGHKKSELEESIKELVVDTKHHLKLRMVTSTSLADDLYSVDCLAKKLNVQMKIEYEIDESYSNKPARVVVSLNPNYDYYGKSKSESDK